MQQFRTPLSIEDSKNKLKELGLTEDEARLMTVPIVNLVKDKALMSRADKAFSKRGDLTRKNNDDLNKQASKKSKGKIAGPFVHTYETT